MKLGKLSVCLLTLSAVSTNTLVALAQEQATTDRLTKLETAAATAQSGADNAWMLVSAALVLMMTDPASPCSIVVWCERRMYSRLWRRVLS